MRTHIPRVLIILLGLTIGVITVYAQETVQAKVLPIQLNVRQSPSTDAPVLGQLLHGMTVTVTGRQDAGAPMWVAITAPDLSGWVRSDFLQFPDGYDLNRLPVTAASGAAVASNNPPAGNVTAPPGSLTGTTRTIVNLRAGPGTSFAVLVMLPFGTTVALTGRSADGTWLRGVANGQEGWLSAGYVRVNGDRLSLPVVGADTTSVPASGSPGSAWGVPVGVVPTITAHAHQIFVFGQSLGNRADVFSKVGDSITSRPQFLTVIGDGGLHLENYGYLQPVVDYYFHTTARTHNSFANISLAAHEGWTSLDLLNPSKADSSVCQPDEAPLVCEYRVVKPAVALIMIGTNDAKFGVTTENYRNNLAVIIQKSLDMGVIPVVSTIPDNLQDEGEVSNFNRIIHEETAQFDVPLWDYWMALQGLPNHGLDPDGTHPSQGSSETAVFTEHDVTSYGYTMRNLTALLVLDAVWKGALY